MTMLTRLIGHYLRLVGVLVVVLCGWTAAQDDQDPNHGVVFIYPTVGLTFYYRDTVDVTYTSPFSEPLLYTFCMSDSGSVIQKRVDRVPAYNGTAPTLLNWTTDGPPCWFNLRPNTTAGHGANSEQWQYEITVRSQTTLGPDSTATTSTTSTSTSASTASTETSSISSTAAGTASSTPSSSSSGSGSLSVGAQAGIGIGAALGGIGLGALGAILYLRHRKKAGGDTEKTAYSSLAPASPTGGLSNADQSQDQSAEFQASSSTVDRNKYNIGPVSELVNDPAPQELSSTPPLHELPLDGHR